MTVRGCGVQPEYDVIFVFCVFDPKVSVMFPLLTVSLSLEVLSRHGADTVVVRSDVMMAEVLRQPNVHFICNVVMLLQGVHMARIQ